MSAARRSRASPASSAEPAWSPTAATEPAEDPRFASLCAALAADPRHARAVEDYGTTRGSAPGRRFGANALRTGGRIFAMMSGGNLVVKLPRVRVDALIAAGAGARFDPGHGRAMKEWIALTNDASEWPPLAREAHDFVGGAPRR